MKIKYLILTLLSVSLFSACGGNNLEDDFFGSGNEGPVNLQVRLIHHLNGGEFAELGEGGIKEIENNLEITIRIQDLSVYLSRLVLNPVTSSLISPSLDINTLLDLSGEDGTLLDLISGSSVLDVSYEGWELTLGTAEIPALTVIFTFAEDAGATVFEISIPGEIVAANIFMARESNGELAPHNLHRAPEETALGFMFGFNYQLLFENVEDDMNADELAALLENNLRNLNVMHQHQLAGGHHNN